MNAKILFLAVALIYSNCDGQELQKYNQRQQGKKIQILGTGILVTNFFYRTHSPVVGAGVIGVGMIIELKANKKNERKRQKISKRT